VRKGWVVSGAVSLASVGLGGLAAGASTTPSSGVFHAEEVQINNEIPHDVITGAIIDSGVDHVGAADKGLVNKVVLSRGTIEANTGPLSKAIKSAYQHTYVQPDCSAFIKVRGSGTVINGTGAYAGISGNWTATWEMVETFPLQANGSCKVTNSTQPTGSITTVIVSGTVKVS
jgi:hypothetical protein